MSEFGTALPELTSRQEQVLSYIVHAYTQDSRPVGSNHLVETYDLGVSSATVRKEMSELERLGYIHAPHTSAGRVPTTTGYRYFVKRLLPTDALTTMEHDRITHKFNQLPMVLDQWMRQAATLLAQTSNSASLITSPSADTNHFKHLEIISIQGRLALMVLVLEGGTVHQRLITLTEPISQETLSQTAEQINKQCANLSVNKIRIRKIHLGILGSEIIDVVVDLMLETDGSGTIYRDGLSDIIHAFPHSSGAQQAVRVFEERDFLSVILNDVISPIMNDDGEVQVVIAGDGRWDELDQISLVLKHYGLPGKISGTLGVIGPTNINYGRAISTVRHISEIMTDQIEHLFAQPNEEEAQE